MSKLSASFALIALFSGTALTAAQAQTASSHVLGQHPAVIVSARVQTIDPNLYIVQPPASVTWGRSHANGEHPALLAARRATAIDSNTFQVQPPASVTWTTQPAENAAPVVASISR